MPLKELEVKYASKRQYAYKLSDGGGLHLLVQPKGSKLWRPKHRFGGKEKLLSSGKYPEVTLAIASERRTIVRERRKETKALLGQGKGPGEALTAKRKAPPPTTFEPIAHTWHASRVEGLDAAHAKRLINRVERDVFPAIGNRPIAELDAPEILAMIRGARRAGPRCQPAPQTGRQAGFPLCDRKWMGDGRSTLSLNDALEPKPPVKQMARVPLTDSRRWFERSSPTMARIRRAPVHLAHLGAAWRNPLRNLDRVRKSRRSGSALAPIARAHEDGA